MGPYVERSPRDLAQHPYLEQALRLMFSLGPLFRVYRYMPETDSDTRDHDACDWCIALPRPMGGSYTACLAAQRWCPGGRLHAESGTTDGKTWYGVNLGPYRGKDWVERLAEGMREAARRALRDDIAEYTRPNTISRWEDWVAKARISLAVLEHDERPSLFWDGDFLLVKPPGSEPTHVVVGTPSRIEAITAEDGSVTVIGRHAGAVVYERTGTQRGQVLMCRNAKFAVARAAARILEHDAIQDRETT